MSFFDGVQVVKFSEFAKKINEITVNQPTPHSLEEFLRALWRIILIEKDKQPSWELFHQIISAGWTGEPMDFEETWLSITKNADFIESDTNSTLDDFDYLKATILFQIADLRRMENAGYWKRDPWSMIDGVASPTGESWYNLSPEIFMQCAVSGLTDHQKNDNTAIDVPDENITWRNLAELLILGQLYE